MGNGPAISALRAESLTGSPICKSIKYFPLWRQIHNIISKKRGVFLVFRRGQAAMEFLMTYGWAILVVLIVIGVMTYSGFVDVSGLLPEKCTFPISVNCLDYSVKKDSINLHLQNAAGRVMLLRNIEVTSEVLMGPSDSDPGVCELSPSQRNYQLKKGAKHVFNLNVRSSTALASGPEGSVNDLNLLADGVMLVRAQDSCGDWEAAKREAETAKSAAEAKYNAVRYAARAVANAADNAAEPSFYNPTVDSVHQKAKDRADDFLNADGNTAAFNEIVSYYAGLVADEANRNNPGNAHAAYQNVYNKRDLLLTEVPRALKSLKAEAVNANVGADAGSVADAARPVPDDFNDDFSFHYATMVHKTGARSGDDYVSGIRTKAVDISGRVNNSIDELFRAAETEAGRIHNVESVMAAARAKVQTFCDTFVDTGTFDCAASSSGSNLHGCSAARFIYNTVADYSDADEAAAKAKEEYEKLKCSFATLLSSSYRRCARSDGCGLFASIKLAPDLTVDQAKSTIRNSCDWLFTNRTLGQHYLDLMASGITGDTGEEVKASFDCAYTNLNRDFLKAASGVSKSLTLEAARKPTNDTVATAANKKVPHSSDVTWLAVSLVAASATGTTRDDVASNVRAAAENLKRGVALAVNSVVYKAENSNNANRPSVSSIKAAVDLKASSYNGKVGHRAAVFVAGIADVDADDPSDVIGNIERDVESLEGAIVSATQEVVQAANDEAVLSVREIEPDVAYVQEEADSVVDSLRLQNHPGLAAAEFVAGVISSGPGSAREAADRALAKRTLLIQEAFASQRAAQERFGDLSTCVSQCRAGIINDHIDCPVSLLDCSVLGVSCSDGVDCCSGVCEAGSCADVTIPCGSLGLACCDGSTCNGGLVCDGVTCVGAVVECDSVGQACCAGSTCNESLVCDGGTCMDATVSIPTTHYQLDTHSFDAPIDPGSPVEFPVSNIDIPFQSVNFTVSDTVQNLNLTITSQSKLPSGIPEGPGVVPSSNGYVNITSNLDPDYFDNGNVSSVNVTFRVERSFVSDNGVSPDEISLFRYDGGEWIELDTVHLPDLDVLKNDNYHYYEVTGTDDLLGVFAIALSQYISCAHIENSKGKNRYNIELVYSWQDSQSINHRIKGELLASAPK